VKKLIVFDFVGPDRNITALGVKLADDFSQALSEADHKLKIENRAALPQWAKEAGYGPEDFLDSGSIIPLGSFLRMNAAVLGAISVKDGQTTLSIYAFRFTKTGVSRIDGQDTVIPSSDGNSKMIQTYIVRGGTTSDAADLSAVGMRGYSYPKCLQCPTLLFRSIKTWGTGRVTA